MASSMHQGPEYSLDLILSQQRGRWDRCASFTQGLDAALSGSMYVCGEIDGPGLCWPTLSPSS